MTKVDEPMPQAALEAINRHHKPDNTTTERKSGIEWLRKRLKGRYGPRVFCEDHYHLECLNCGSRKCVGESGYNQYERKEHSCSCGELTEHIAVPFDDFDQYVGFPD